jgi:hypothetical protein
VTLLHNVSRSVFWNTALLPIVTAAGFFLSILVRRKFGLESGLYDVALGIANSILFYSSLGLAGSMPKFLPELQLSAGRRAAARLVLRLGALRLAIVVAILIPMNVWAEPLARSFNLGTNGTAYLHLLSLVLIGRAALDFAYRALDSFFQQLTVNILSLVHGVLDVTLVAVAIFVGLRIGGVIGALGLSAALMAVVATIVTLKQLHAIREDAAQAHTGPAPSRVWKLSFVTYLRDL